MHCRANVGVDRKEVLRKRHVVLLAPARRSGDQVAETTVRPAALQRVQIVPGMRAWWCRLAASESLHLLSAAATRSINRPPLVTTRSPGARPLSTSIVLPLVSPTLIRWSSIAFSLFLSRTTQTRAASPS